MFSKASVSHSVHRGFGGLPTGESASWGLPPGELDRPPRSASGRSACSEGGQTLHLPPTPQLPGMPQGGLHPRGLPPSSA